MIKELQNKNMILNKIEKKIKIEHQQHLLVDKGQSALDQ